MTEQELDKLITAQGFPDHQICSEKRETHISWVLLCQDFVYKIKKPVQFSFLDFSTLDKRKYLCEKEVQLNQRLAPSIYLDIVPICSDHAGFYIQLFPCPATIVEYAVRMKRMDNTRAMSLMLSKGEVADVHLEKLAIQLSHFHLNTELVHPDNPAKSLFEDFQDLFNIKSFIENHLGQEGLNQIGNMIDFAFKYTTYKKELIETRCEKGFFRDCHGDLHSGNIILSEEPIIFDCIEFNDHFRHIDILNELAFFCMDLEFYGRADLALKFMEYYSRHFPALEDPSQENLFLFYKFYRANVKTKVNALKCSQAASGFDQKDRFQLFFKYFELMKTYYYHLTKNSDL